MLLRLLSLFITGVLGVVGGFFGAEAIHPSDSQSSIDVQATKREEKTLPPIPASSVSTATETSPEEVALHVPSLVNRSTVESESVSAPIVEEKPLNPYSAVSVAGIIAGTNDERSKRRVGRLKEDPLLRQMAERKVDDMFARQYFAHESPSGDNVQDLAENVGYEYLFVGENLALGKFTTSAEIVKAWMNSPGHRENMLKPQYEQIGVAARTGMYEGRTVWIAVQEFGLPTTSCTAPESALKTEISQSVIELATLRDSITALHDELSSMNPSQAGFVGKTDEYNELVDEHNLKVDRYKKNVAVYNDEVEEYNKCVAKKTE